MQSDVQIRAELLFTAPTVQCRLQCSCVVGEWCTEFLMGVWFYVSCVII